MIFVTFYRFLCLFNPKNTVFSWQLLHFISFRFYSRVVIPELLQQLCYSSSNILGLVRTFTLSMEQHIRQYNYEGSYEQYITNWRTTPWRMTQPIIEQNYERQTQKGNMNDGTMNETALQSVIPVQNYILVQTIGTWKIGSHIVV